MGSGRQGLREATRKCTRARVYVSSSRVSVHSVHEDGRMLVAVNGGALSPTAAHAGHLPPMAASS